MLMLIARYTVVNFNSLRPRLLPVRKALSHSSKSHRMP